MNKKAESFKKYLDDKKITCFTVDEVLILKLTGSSCRQL